MALTCLEVQFEWRLWSTKSPAGVLQSLVCTNSGLRHVTLCIPYAGGSADAHRERQFAKGHSGLSEDWSVLASCHVTLWLIEIGVCPANTLKLPGKPGPFKRGLLLFAKGFSEASSLAELGDLSVLTETYWFEASAWKHRHCLNLTKFVQEGIERPNRPRIRSFSVCHLLSMCSSYTCHTMSNGCCFRWANSGNQIQNGLRRHPSKWFLSCVLERLRRLCSIAQNWPWEAACFQYALSMPQFCLVSSQPFWDSWDFLRPLWLKELLARLCCRMQHAFRRHIDRDKQQGSIWLYTWRWTCRMWLQVHRQV
jgi:hypothetical protein